MSIESPSQCAAVIHPPPERPLEGNPEEDDEFNALEHQILDYFDADILLRERREKEKKEGRIRRGIRSGGIGVITDFDDIHADLIEYSKQALEKYNAEIHKNQKGEEEMFVFHDMVKAIHKPCGMFFITFHAKKAGGGDGDEDDDAILTFLAKVWQAFCRPPRIFSCFLKPT